MKNLILFSFIFVALAFLVYREGSSSEMNRAAQKPMPELVEVRAAEDAANLIQKHLDFGVRQDVLEGLERSYLRNPQIYRVALQTARNFQEILNGNRSDEEIRYEISREIACRSLRLSPHEAVALGRHLEELTFDTPERQDIYFEWNSKWDARFLEPHPLEESACDY